MACGSFKIIDKICIHTSIETIMYYEYQIMQFVLSGKIIQFQILFSPEAI